MGAYSPDAHRNQTFLHPNFWQRIDPVSGRTKHSEWLRRHDDAFANSKEEFAKHFKRRYPGENPPIWIAAELWDFGAMSVLFSGLNKVDQLAIAAKFQLPAFRIMETWLRSLNTSRNVCAHHSRFWNKASAVQPSWPTATQVPDLSHIAKDTHAQTRAYGTACMCAYLLRTINPNTTWRKRFKDLIAKFPQSKIVSLQGAGFPKNWENEKLWN
jgi:abortive infection bacteriophage resistance protein